MRLRPLILYVLLVCGNARVADAQMAADTLRLADAIKMALTANPMLHAARLSAVAGTERIRPAGTLPDPQLQLGLMNRMVSAFGSTADPMTMNQLQLTQTVPWRGKLASARSAASHAAAALGADADAQERTVSVQVRAVYYDAAFADRALDVMRRTLGLLRDFQEVSGTLYAVGIGVQQDVLRAKVEVARATEDIVKAGEDRIAAVARLNALLGRDAMAQVAALELPDVMATELPPVDTLIAWALGSAPSLHAGAERVAAAQASAESARLSLFPDVQVSLAYGARPAFPDMLSLTVGVDLPLFADARQRPMRREAGAMMEMSQAVLRSARNETIAQVIEARARAERDRHLVQLYRTSVLPQAQASVEAALASYRVGRVNFLTLIDNSATVNRYEIETQRLVADYQKAIGDLEALVGRSPEKQP